MEYDGEDGGYEDEGVEGEGGYLLVKEKGEVVYEERERSGFGRGDGKELGKMIE